MKKSKWIFTLPFVVLALFVASCTAGYEEEESESDNKWMYEEEKDVYDTHSISGFTVNILHDITTHAEGNKAWSQLQEDIASIAKKITSSATLDALRKHQINIINKSTLTIGCDDDPASEYYGSIVIGDIGVYKNIVQRNQPNLLLKYMAMIYYDKYMSSSQKSAVEAAYSANRDSYASVYQSNGIKLELNKVASPAMDDAYNYFLELSEAYFDGNDYYPFDYAELERHDRSGMAALAGVWGTRTIEPNPYGVSLPPVGTKVGPRNNQIDIDLWHRKYTVANCNGYEYMIVGSRFVADSVFMQARTIIELMSTDKTGTDYMNRAMYWNNYYKYYIGIVGRNEVNSDLPELRDKTWVSNSAYGYGSTPGIPMLMIVETDICGPGIGGVKLGQSLLSHEFGHNIDDGLGYEVPGMTAELISLYDNVVTTQGKWAGTYAATDYREYWAEATSAWYNAGSKGMFVTIGEERKAIVTRDDLRNYDPDMYNFMSRYYPDNVKLTGFHFDW